MEVEGDTSPPPTKTALRPSLDIEGNESYKLMIIILNLLRFWKLNAAKEALRG